MNKKLLDRFFGALFGGILYLIPSLIFNPCELIYRIFDKYKSLYQMYKDNDTNIINSVFVSIIVYPVWVCLELLYTPFNLIFKFLQGTVHGFKDGITSNVQKLRQYNLLSLLQMMLDSDSLWGCIFGNKASTISQTQDIKGSVDINNTFVDTAKIKKNTESQNIIKDDQSNISGQTFFENKKQSNIGNNKDEPIIPTDFVV